MIPPDDGPAQQKNLKIELLFACVAQSFMV